MIKIAGIKLFKRMEKLLKSGKISENDFIKGLGNKQNDVVSYKDLLHKDNSDKYNIKDVISSIKNRAGKKTDIFSHRLDTTGDYAIPKNENNAYKGISSSFKNTKESDGSYTHLWSTPFKHIADWYSGGKPVAKIDLTRAQKVGPSTRHIGLKRSIDFTEEQAKNAKVKNLRRPADNNRYYERTFVDPDYNSFVGFSNNNSYLNMKRIKDKKGFFKSIDNDLDELGTVRDMFSKNQRGTYYKKFLEDNSVNNSVKNKLTSLGNKYSIREKGSTGLSDWVKGYM